MTDEPFLDALERELRAAHPRRRAARRRAAADRVLQAAPAATGLLLVAGVGIALSGALEGEGPSSPVRPAAPPPPTTPGGAALQGVRVAVLNGTPSTGLARRVGDRLRAAGATLGTLANGPDPRTPQTLVLHRPGASGAASRVLAVVGLGRTGSLDAATRRLASEADVVVVAGADLVDAGTPLPRLHAEVSCPRVGAEQTAPTVDPARGDVEAGGLAVLGARATIGLRPDAFGRRGFKLPVTVADGAEVLLAVPPSLAGKVGLVFTLPAQRAVARRGVRAADRTTRFTACAPGGDSPRTGWPGGIVTDRPRCAVLTVVDAQARSRRLRVPLGRACG